MDYFTVNPSFGQQIIFVELAWSSLILKAAYGPKKTSWKSIYMKVFSSNYTCLQITFQKSHE